MLIRPIYSIQMSCNRVLTFSEKNFARCACVIIKTETRRGPYCTKSVIAIDLRSPVGANTRLVRMRRRLAGMTEASEHQSVLHQSVFVREGFVIAFVIKYIYVIRHNVVSDKMGVMMKMKVFCFILSRLPKATR